MRILITAFLFTALATAQSVTASFDGVKGNGTGTPQGPNASMSVSGTQILEVTAQTLGFFDYSGNQIKAQVDFLTFLGSVSPTITCTSRLDPRSIYDSFISRWIIVQSCNTGDWLIVSSGSDLTTATWKGVKLNFTTGDLTMRPCSDANGVYISEYDNIGSPLTYAWFAIPGADLVWSGAGSPSLANLQTFTLQGFEAHCMEDMNASKAATDPEFFVYGSQPRGITSNFSWQVKYVTWPSGGVTGACTNGAGSTRCATVSSAQSLATSYAVSSTTADTGQVSPGNPIKTSESIQVFFAQQAGSRGYAIRASGPCVSNCSSGAANTLDRIIWSEFDLTNKDAVTIRQKGELASASTAYIFPTITSDPSNNVEITAMCWNTTTPLGVCEWHRKAGDALNTLNGPNIVQGGTGAYTCLSNNPVTVGKYFNGVQDPSNNANLWIFSQYSASATDCAWATRIFRMTFAGQTTVPRPPTNLTATVN